MNKKLKSGKSKKANEKRESLETISPNQEKKSKAGNLYAGVKKSAQSENLIAERGSRVTSRDAVRAKSVESHNRRP
jgi:hypothetical protein